MRSIWRRTSTSRAALSLKTSYSDLLKRDNLLRPFQTSEKRVRTFSSCRCTTNSLPMRSRLLSFCTRSRCLLVNLETVSDTWCELCVCMFLYILQFMGLFEHGLHLFVHVVDVDGLHAFQQLLVDAMEEILDSHLVHHIILVAHQHTLSHHVGPHIQHFLLHDLDGAPQSRHLGLHLDLVVEDVSNT